MVTTGVVFQESSKLFTKEAITLNVNGRRYKFSVGDGTRDVSSSETLVETLRKRLQLTGSKESCGAGACGCSAVIADGDAIALNCPKCDEHGFSSSLKEHPGRARSAGLPARTHSRQASPNYTDEAEAIDNALYALQALENCLKFRTKDRSRFTDRLESVFLGPEPLS